MTVINDNEDYRQGVRDALEHCQSLFGISDNDLAALSEQILGDEDLVNEQ